MSVHGGCQIVSTTGIPTTLKLILTVAHVATTGASIITNIMVPHSYSYCTLYLRIMFVFIPYLFWPSYLSIYIGIT